MKNIKLIIVLFINLCIVVSTYAQDRGTTCTSCFNQYISVQGDYTSHLGLENNSYGNYSLSGGWLSETSSSSTASMAFGYRALTVGQYSFALGLEVQAQGNKSFAFGTNVISSGENTKVMGSNIQGIANFSVTLGSGYSTEIPFYNIKDYSFAIATKSDRATLFVSKSPGPLEGTTGKVGIGTIDPRAKLHIVSDEGEEASLFIELVLTQQKRMLL